METRRDFLQAVAGTTAIGLGTTTSLIGSQSAGVAASEDAQSNGGKMHPPEPKDGRLKDLWDATVRELVQLPEQQFSEGQRERHYLYCGLVAALITHYWNGNKSGKNGKYPWRSKQIDADGQYRGGDYLGHNIACIAVDATGEVIDFDFNHNEIFSSSVEHAESRLVRRIFSLAQLNNGWATKGLLSAVKPRSYVNILSDVTIYTSLESCSQCSGIMALGAVKEVVYLHRDPGQASIGNILRRLSPEKSSFKAPLPIPADSIGFQYFSKLDAAYEGFRKQVGTKPFFVPKSGSPDSSSSITSFLCTDNALDIFAAAKAELDQTDDLQAPEYKPRDLAGDIVPNSLTNREVLHHIRAFFDYASHTAKRGTPHQL